MIFFKCFQHINKTFKYSFWLLNYYLSKLMILKTQKNVEAGIEQYF
jgi:hypothetical protein